MTRAALPSLAPPGRPTRPSEPQTAVNQRGKELCPVRRHEAEGQPAEKKPEAPKISPDEPMSEAGRKILYTHFCRMVENEKDTREGDDPEALHDMRVATRRMRPLSSFLSRISNRSPRSLWQDPEANRRTLGAVRDLDVLIAKAEAFGAAEKEDKAAGPQPLAPLLAAWHRRREAAPRGIARLPG